MKFLTLAGMVETELFAQTYKSYGLTLSTSTNNHQLSCVMDYLAA